MCHLHASEKNFFMNTVLPNVLDKNTASYYTSPTKASVDVYVLSVIDTSLLSIAVQCLIESTLDLYLYISNRQISSMSASVCLIIMYFITTSNCAFNVWEQKYYNQRV